MKFSNSGQTASEISLAERRETKRRLPSERAEPYRPAVLRFSA